MLLVSYTKAISPFLFADRLLYFRHHTPRSHVFQEGDSIQGWVAVHQSQLKWSILLAKDWFNHWHVLQLWLMRHRKILPWRLLRKVFLDVKKMTHKDKGPFSASGYCEDVIPGAAAATLLTQREVVRRKASQAENSSVGKLFIWTAELTKPTSSILWQKTIAFCLYSAAKLDCPLFGSECIPPEMSQENWVLWVALKTWVSKPIHP